jgi:hypothetical protein
MSQRRSWKRNRTAVVGVILALGLALTGVGVAGAAGLRFQHCGTLRGPGGRFAILAYRARCGTARRVFGALFTGKGRRRRDPSTGQIDRVIDGWICGSGAGGFGCGKLGPHGKILPYKPRQPVIDAEAVSPAAPLTKLPPCTRKALAAGLKRGANKIPGAPIEGFRCAGRWAIAVVLDGVDDVPALFHARGTRWVTVNREKPCRTHAVPKKIYATACLAS